MTATELCPVCCEGHLIKSEQTLPLMIDSKQVYVEQHGHVCDLCGTEISTAEDLKFNARVYRSAELRNLGKMTGNDIKLLRQGLHISHKVAGQLFGGGPVAFCKYENHDITPTDAMDNLLWVASKYPAIIKALAERHGVALPNVPSGVPDVLLDMNAPWGKIFPGNIANAAIRNSNVHKMWENVPIKMEPSASASNEMTVNFELPIAA